VKYWGLDECDGDMSHMYSQLNTLPSTTNEKFLKYWGLDECGVGTISFVEKPMLKENSKTANVKDVKIGMKVPFKHKGKKKKYRVPIKKIIIAPVEEKSVISRVCEKYNIKLTSKNSASHGDDAEWIIPKETIFEYLDEAIMGGGNWSRDFLKQVYKDPRYIEWSRTYASKECMKVSKGNNYVISSGNCFKNWKKDGQSVCESLHLIKQLYNRLKRRNFK